MPVAKRAESRGILNCAMFRSPPVGWGWLPRWTSPSFIHQKPEARARPLPRPSGVDFDLERPDRLLRRDTRDRIPALLDVIVGHDLVLLRGGEPCVLRQRIAEAR